MRLAAFAFLPCLVSSASSGKAPLSTPYYTEFAAQPPNWTLLEGCSHCSGGSGGSGSSGGSGGSGVGSRSGHSDECTSNHASSASFGALGGGTGMRLNTSHLDGAPDCDPRACALSAHNSFDPPLFYGSFEVVARWFPTAAANASAGPGAAAAVATATGFIGLDSPSNEASITMGFHGDGWPTAGEGAHKYQHGIYAHVAGSHNRNYTDTGEVNIATTFNRYGLVWAPTHVTWLLNGLAVRNFTDAAQIPAVPLYQRLHSRSGDCAAMPSGSSFAAEVKSFRYTPLAPIPPAPPTPPTPPAQPTPAPAPPSAACAAAGGIPDGAADVCCLAECGTCSGGSCGDRPGGHAGCCSNAIEKAGVACTTSGKAPCTL